METIFYDLKPISSEWKIAFTNKQNKEAEDIIEHLSERQIIEISKPISMSVYNFIQEKDEWKDKSPFDFDALRWSDDITLNAITLFEPIAHIIISSKLKELVEKFHLPTHKFYPVTLTNIHDKETESGYLFYMPEDDFNYIDWKACEFKLEQSYLDKGKIDVEYIGPGVANNFDDFRKLRQEYRGGTIKKFLRFYKVVFTVAYDVMWGLPNILTISHNLKEAIVSESIKVDISEHKELIILPS